MYNYDTIGINYNSTRIPDKRILNILIEELACTENSLIADIGAGTGNYSYELAKYGYDVNTVEPSAAMINQAKQHTNMSWFRNIAEELPFKNDSVDGIVCILASHHFDSPVKAFKEFYRVLKPGARLVNFTFDLRLMSKQNWLADCYKTWFD